MAIPGDKMYISKIKSRWIMSFGRPSVNLLKIDNRIIIVFQDQQDSAELIIESSFILCNSDGQNFTIVPDNKETIFPIFNVLNEIVTDIVTKEDCSLFVKFENKSYISIPPDSNFEAWQISCLGRFIITSSPGGDISFIEEPSGHLAI